MVYGDTNPADARATDALLLGRLECLMRGERVGIMTLTVCIQRGWLGLRQTAPLKFTAYLTRAGAKEVRLYRRAHGLSPD